MPGIAASSRFAIDSRQWDNGTTPILKARVVNGLTFESPRMSCWIFVSFESLVWNSHFQCVIVMRFWVWLPEQVYLYHKCSSEMTKVTRFRVGLMTLLVHYAANERKSWIWGIESLVWTEVIGKSDKIWSCWVRDVFQIQPLCWRDLQDSSLKKSVCCGVPMDFSSFWMREWDEEIQIPCLKQHHKTTWTAPMPPWKEQPTNPFVFFFRELKRNERSSALCQIEVSDASTLVSRRAAMSLSEVLKSLGVKEIWRFLVVAQSPVIKEHNFKTLFWSNRGNCQYISRGRLG